jgi:CheY-like chemotaxis protein
VTDLPALRVLFVVADSDVAGRLEKVLADRKGRWDMSFVSSGADALAALAAVPRDVVVADMQLPGMDGAHLLREVRDRFPGTARIALAGPADRHLIVRSLDAIHRHVAKPCDVVLLCAAVEQAHAISTLLASPGRLLASGEMSRG